MVLISLPNIGSHSRVVHLSLLLPCSSHLPFFGDASPSKMFLNLILEDTIKDWGRGRGLGDVAGQQLGGRGG